MDDLALYQVLYQLISGGGREEALFGDCGPLAEEAFSRSLVGNEFPVVWFELPLAGPPRFDLHAAISREALRPGVGFAAGAGNGYDELFRWYAEVETGGHGLAFAYDVSEGQIDLPAVHVNVNHAPLDDMGRFFQLAAETETGAAERYRNFVGRLPEGWRVWYAGVHPGRPGAPVRVDCFVSSDLKKAYAQDLTLLERGLAACGFVGAEQAVRDLASLILSSPFTLELQFDLMRDGTLGPTLGLSAGLGLAARHLTGADAHQEGPMSAFMAPVEARGLADGRWRQGLEATLRKLVSLDEGSLALYCIPTFVKLRLREGAPLDAKLYLEASVIRLPS